MIICDKWADFYDYAGQGRDEAIKLDRDIQVASRIEGSHGAPDTSALYNSVDRYTRDSVVAGYVVLGGMGRPVAIIERREEGHSAYTRNWIYDPAALVREIAPWRQGTLWAKSRLGKYQIAALSAFLEEPPKDLGLIAIEHKMISGLLCRISNFSFIERTMIDKLEWTPMPAIKTKIQDVLPAHEAHMMVARFVGGIMTEKHVIPELSDASKIAKAGFYKQSFRKRRE